MTSKLALFNAALLEVNERQLASVNDDVPYRRYLDGAWDQEAINKLLMAGQWQFAARAVKLSPDDNASASFGHPYVFPIPEDHIRTNVLTTDEFFRLPLMNYEIDAHNWFASVTPIYCKYVSNDITYGSNLSRWPPNFSEFAAMWLAWKILPKLTGNKTDRAELRKRVDKALVVAQSTDAMEEGVKFPPAGSWVNARQRGRTGSGYDRGAWNTLYGT